MSVWFYDFRLIFYLKSLGVFAFVVSASLVFKCIGSNFFFLIIFLVITKYMNERHFYLQLSSSASNNVSICWGEGGLYLPSFIW